MKKIQIYVENIKYCEEDKQVILLANSLSNYFEIVIVSIGEIKNEIVLNKKVKLVEFNTKETTGYINGLRLKNSLTKFIKNNPSDIIISTSVNINKILCNVPSDAEYIYWRLDDNDINIFDNRKASKRIDKIVFTNEEEKNKYKASDIEEIVISPAITSVTLDFEYVDSKNILYMDNLNDFDTFKELIDILMIVLKYDENIKLYIIGDGDRRIDAMNYCKSKGVQNSVAFYGSLDSNEIDYELKRMSLFINLGNTFIANYRLIEAMNYGIPPISYENETLKNIIENDINGYLVSKHNVDDFADKILQIFSSSDSLLNMRQCARETSMFYEINSIKSEWLKIL